MTRSNLMKPLLLAVGLPLLYLADISPAPLGLTLVREARHRRRAVTPVSVAGVARRATRRAVVATNRPAAATTATAATAAQQQSATAQQQSATAQQDRCQKPPHSGGPARGPAIGSIVNPTRRRKREVREASNTSARQQHSTTTALQGNSRCRGAAPGGARTRVGGALPNRVEPGC
jgi:hypothetical protein